MPSSRLTSRVFETLGLYRSCICCVTFVNLSPTPLQSKTPSVDILSEQRKLLSSRIACARESDWMEKHRYVFLHRSVSLHGFLFDSLGHWLFTDYNPKRLVIILPLCPFHWPWLPSLLPQSTRGKKRSSWLTHHFIKQIHHFTRRRKKKIFLLSFLNFR